jgi:hypothetical protein
MQRTEKLYVRPRCDKEFLELEGCCQVRSLSLQTVSPEKPLPSEAGSNTTTVVLSPPSKANGMKLFSYFGSKSCNDSYNDC